jgi:hypothetical protein
MTEKKLYLLQFTSIYVAKLGTSPPKIMRCKMIEFHSRCAQFRTTHQTTFSEMPFPHAVP